MGYCAHADPTSDVLSEPMVSYTLPVNIVKCLTFLTVLYRYYVAGEYSYR